MNAQEARRNGLAQDGVKQTHQRDDHKYWPDDAQRKAERACRPNTRKVQDIVQCIDATCLRWSVSSRPAHHEAAGFRVAEFRNFCRVPDAMLDSENRTLLWDQAKSWILVTRTPLVWRTDRLYDRWGWLRLYLSSITACGSNEPEPHPWYFTLLVRALQEVWAAHSAHWRPRETHGRYRDAGVVAYSGHTEHQPHDTGRGHADPTDIP